MHAIHYDQRGTLESGYFFELLFTDFLVWPGFREEDSPKKPWFITDVLYDASLEVDFQGNRETLDCGCEAYVADEITARVEGVADLYFSGDDWIVYLEPTHRLFQNAGLKGYQTKSVRVEGDQRDWYALCPADQQDLGNLVIEGATPKCPCCGHEMVCSACYSLHRVCPQCNEGSIRYLGSQKGPPQPVPRIEEHEIPARLTLHTAVVDVTRWNGEDFFYTNNLIVTRRTLEFIAHHRLGPLCCKPILARTDQIDQEKRALLKRAAQIDGLVPRSPLNWFWRPSMERRDEIRRARAFKSRHKRFDKYARAFKTHANKILALIDERQHK
ncbi:hypothetical protein [Novipirellula sp.]|uniref:hypothetical protein n=1 Tax=Novipirellula sp. TaxID=2795430 RepID=UPI003569067E